MLPVGSTGTGVSWQQDEARAIIDEYTTRVDELTTQYADAIADTAVLPINTSEEGWISIGRDRVTSIALEDVGARFGSAWTAATPEIEYGPENVTAASDAVAMIAAISSEQDLQAMNANPLWTGLPAMRSDRIVRTDKFTNDGGPLTALWTLGLVEKLYDRS